MTNTPSYLLNLGQGYTLGHAYTTNTGAVISATGKLNVADKDGFAQTEDGAVDYKFSIIGNNNGATVSIAADGTWTYTPDPTFSGRDDILVRVVDAEGFVSSHYFHVTVTPNIAPSAPVPGTDKITGKSGDLWTGDLDVTDINGIDNPNFTDVSILGHYSGDFNIDPSTGKFTYTGRQDSGTDIEYAIVRVTDNLGMTSTINVHLDPLVDATSYVA